MAYTVTQEDREAAAAWLSCDPDSRLPAGERYELINAIRGGERDSDPLAQSFARHRIETLERAADVAAAYDCECEQAPDCSCWNSGVPAAIRALKGKSDE